MGARRNRTFTGCWKCRERKVKCDEGRPGCLACKRLGLQCAGYTPKLVWVRGNEQIQSADGRRMLNCKATWAGYDTLSSDLLDILITRHDEVSDPRQPGGLAYPEASHYNPFTVFLAAVPRQLEPHAGYDCLDLIPGQLLDFPDFSQTDRFLFHHYVTQVAAIMMPYSHPRNPWKFHYPAAALHQISLNQGALYSAMLSQAAFNVAHLRGGSDGSEMTSVGARHYSSAVQNLIQQIGRQGEADFAAMITSTLTLMFAEIYAGESQKWRHHLAGAWALLEEHYRRRQSWPQNDLALVSIQSLNIIKIISGTANHQCYHELSNEKTLASSPSSAALAEEMVSSVLITADFGFTIGAPSVILECINRITKFRDTRDSPNLRTAGAAVAAEDGNYGADVTDRSDAAELVQDILTKLNEYRQKHIGSRHICGRSSISSSSGSSCDDDDENVCEVDGVVPSPAEGTVFSSRCAEYLQSTAFLYATYIYLYRALLHAPPATVRPYVARTLELVLAFSSTSRGNFSIWPAFIAVVEAYRDEDLAAAQRWLGIATSFGLGNRTLIRDVVLEVWRKRSEMAVRSGIDPGLITVDWREVMHEMGCNVLLV
ncbi:fungal-specific transcription factor domain-containing protein [Xylariales sp. PMI_506]|nr:fungal-specific transcription factor domain-containing protein [Xylariales sp. PMI_506]